jgi:AcrR family transcriptional regulator
MSDDSPARLVTKNPGNARGRATLERLSLAALEVAERDGVEATTVDAICLVAGCSRRTFFHHFPSRDAALLGPAVPTVRPEAVAHYLAETIPILAGAIDLVDIPEEMSPTSPLGSRRHALLQASPRLQAATRERMSPAAATVLTAVTAKLAQQPDLDPVEIRPIALAVTTIAAALIQSAHADGSNNPSEALRRLAPVWARLN